MRRQSASLRRNGESGYILVAVVAMVALVMISLAVAVPRVITSLQRDRELELYHRGMQYARAIRLYYRKFGHYPGSIEQLEKTNNIRFLRKRYTDPITKKEEWRMVYFGQSAVINAANAAAAGSNTQDGSNSSNGIFGTSSPSGSSGSSSMFGNSGSSSLGNSGSIFGNNNGASNGSPGASGTSSTTGTGDGSGTGAPGDAGNGATGGTNGNGILGGGGLIVGVSSTSAKASIRILKKQDHYNKWEFVYDAARDTGLAGNNGTGIPQQGLPTNNNNYPPTTNSFGPTNSSGSSNTPPSQNPPSTDTTSN